MTEHAGRGFGSYTCGWYTGPLENRARQSGESQRESGPQRGRMAGQERRIDDTILIREAQSGNRGAFEELVRHYDQAVLRLALHLTGTEHDAQDVYQDAFLKAYRHRKFSFRVFVLYLDLSHRNQSLPGSLAQEDGAQRRCAGGERWQPAGEYDLLDQVPDGRAGANPERDLMRRQLGARISGALEKLTPRERMVFELKHYHGLKLRTVARFFAYHGRDREEHAVPGNTEVARAVGGYEIGEVSESQCFKVSKTLKL